MRHFDSDRFAVPKIGGAENRSHSASRNHAFNTIVIELIACVESNHSASSPGADRRTRGPRLSFSDAGSCILRLCTKQDKETIRTEKQPLDRINQVCTAFLDTFRCVPRYALEQAAR